MSQEIGKEGNVFRCPHDSDHPFTIITNSLLRDATLSFEALGLLCYLLSHSSSWKTRRSVISKEREIGKDKLKRLFDELITKGYMKMVWSNSENGYREVSYWFSEKPKFKNCLPHADFPPTDFPPVDNPHTKERTNIRSTNLKKDIEKESIKEKDTRKIASSLSSPPHKDEFIKMGTEFKNVKVKPQELEKLREFLGDEKVKEWIDKLDEYIEQTGKAYKSHYATILKWSRAEKEKLKENSNFVVAKHRQGSKLAFETTKSGWTPKIIEIGGKKNDLE
jgi:hypothetical protein